MSLCCIWGLYTLGSVLLYMACKYWTWGLELVSMKLNYALVERRFHESDTGSFVHGSCHSNQCLFLCIFDDERLVILERNMLHQCRRTNYKCYVKHSQKTWRLLKIKRTVKFSKILSKLKIKTSLINGLTMNWNMYWVSSISYFAHIQ